jgi:hypothetical protein
MINIFEVFIDVFTFGIYSGYKNQCILDERTKKCTDEINERLRKNNIKNEK